MPFRDTAVEGFENAAAARAFASLPERWQLVLWHTEVEGQKPAEVAPAARDDRQLRLRARLPRPRGPAPGVPHHARGRPRRRRLRLDPRPPRRLRPRRPLPPRRRPGRGAPRRLPRLRGDLPRAHRGQLQPGRPPRPAAARRRGRGVPRRTGAAQRPGLAGGTEPASTRGRRPGPGLGAPRGAHGRRRARGRRDRRRRDLRRRPAMLASHDAADVVAARWSTRPDSTASSRPAGLQPAGTRRAGRPHHRRPGRRGDATSPVDRPAPPPRAPTAGHEPRYRASTAHVRRDRPVHGPTDPTDRPDGPDRGPTDPGGDHDHASPRTRRSTPSFGSTYRVQRPQRVRQVRDVLDRPGDHRPTPAPSTARPVTFDHAGTCVIAADVDAPGRRASVTPSTAERDPVRRRVASAIIPGAGPAVDFHGQPPVDGPHGDATGGARASRRPSPATRRLLGQRVPAPRVTVPLRPRRAPVRSSPTRPATTTTGPTHEPPRPSTSPRGDQTIRLRLPDAPRRSAAPRPRRDQEATPATRSPSTPPPPTLHGRRRRPVTFDHAGTCTVDRAAGRQRRLHRTPTSPSRRRAKGHQTITFALPATASVGTAASPCDATSSDSGNPVTFGSRDADRAPSRASTVTFDHAGSLRRRRSDRQRRLERTATNRPDRRRRQGRPRRSTSPGPGGQVGTDDPLSATSSAGARRHLHATDDTACTRDAAPPSPTTTPAPAPSPPPRPATPTATPRRPTRPSTSPRATRPSTSRLSAAARSAPATRLQATSSAGLDVTVRPTNDSAVHRAATSAPVSFAARRLRASSPRSRPATPTGTAATDRPDHRHRQGRPDRSTSRPVTGARVGAGSPLRRHRDQRSGSTVTFGTAPPSACTVTGYDGAASPTPAPASSPPTRPATPTATPRRRPDRSPSARARRGLTFTVPGKATVGGTDTVTATSDSGGAITFS